MPEDTANPDTGKVLRFVPSTEKSKYRVPELSVVQETITSGRLFCSHVPVNVAPEDSGVVVLFPSVVGDVIPVMFP